MYLICGFMGCGKTTLVNKISELGEAEATDLDELVLARLKENQMHSIAEFVERAGWLNFRDLELECLSEYFDAHASDGDVDYVLALGGGSLSNQVLELIDIKEAQLIWLQSSFEICWERIKGDSHRPLVAKGELYCHELFKQRKSLYARAKLAIQADEVESLQCIKDRIAARQ